MSDGYRQRPERRWNCMHPVKALWAGDLHSTYIHPGKATDMPDLLLTDPCLGACKSKDSHAFGKKLAMNLRIPTPNSMFINIINTVQLLGRFNASCPCLKRNVLVLPKAAKLLCKVPLLDCTTTRYCSPASNL